MNHPRRHVLFSQAAAGAAFIAALGLMGALKVGRSGFPADFSADLAATAPASLHSGAPLDVSYATLIRPATDRMATGVREGVAARYRLVGVVLDDANPLRSLALIEAKDSGVQQRLRVGDELESGVTVQSIAQSEVWVRGPLGEECLTRDGQVASRAPAKAGVVVPGNNAGTTPGDVARFGITSTGDNTWEFRREAIMGYYRELLDRPERLVKVFDSLAPVYDDQHQIGGYRVQIEGEREFFGAVDLRQGDIVRAVNAIEMTNRRRAENLIRRFAEDDLDTVILDVERDGKLIKQIYRTAE